MSPKERRLSIYYRIKLLLSFRHRCPIHQKYKKSFSVDFSFCLKHLRKTDKLLKHFTLTTGLLHFLAMTEGEFYVILVMLPLTIIILIS